MLSSLQRQQPLVGLEKIERFAHKKSRYRTRRQRDSFFWREQKLFFLREDSLQPTVWPSPNSHQLSTNCFIDVSKTKLASLIKGSLL